jgi:hypothetical protein
MIDLIDNRTLLIVGCTALVLAGLIGVLSAFSWLGAKMHGDGNWWR